MTKVQIDDLNCPHCEKVTHGELDIKNGLYVCYKCGLNTEKYDTNEQEKHLNRGSD